MGRYLPAECVHGTQLDWGDFGSCQEGCEEEGHSPEDCPDTLPPCELCDAEEAVAHAAMLAEAVAPVAAERDRYRDALEAIRAAHYDMVSSRFRPDYVICCVCQTAWPCPTVAAIDAALSGVPGTEETGDV